MGKTKEKTSNADQTAVLPHLGGRPFFGLYMIIGVLLLLLAAAASLSFGAASMNLSTAWTAVFYFDPSLTEHQIIHSLRIPRTLADIVAGMSLSLAGAVMQGSTRNPLADSGLMGVNAGAAFAMAISLAFIPNQLYTGSLFISFAGAAMGAGLTYLAASLNRRGMTPQRLVLAGMSITLLFGAMGSFVSLNYGVGKALAYWTSGSVAGATLTELKLTAPWFLGGLALSLFIARSITILSLGEEIAKGFGQRTVLVKLLATLAVLLLAGVSVTLVGPIGFVGLIVPHIVRFFVGVDYRYIIPAAAVYGGVLMVAADLAGRLINRPAETALGIIFAIIGVPFFLLIARRERRAFE
ncbi:FecCD family ABC transporter permease [Paenibacillus gorillae]|uniref:FecCD family ABC transporter permease n=1 Tax=Paenibacillus gorillae TaxID=1243662 RepID=UPI0004B048F0|nr:iron ABC transporter permease [Paenibacillus gorillae]